MKTFVSVVVLLFILTSSTKAYLISKLQCNGVDLIVSLNQDEARSDNVPDATTVRATLTHNVARQAWELRFKNYLTGSYNLTPGLDITAGSDLYIEVIKYPNGHVWGAKNMYVYGTDLHDVDYSDANNLIKMRIKPVSLAISASYNGTFTAVAGVDFRYYGPAQTIAYGPPIIQGNVIWDDLSWAQHPSTGNLLGGSVRVNGVNGQQTDFQFLLGTRYTAYKRYDINQARAYLDGTTPASGFGYTPPATAPYSVNMGSPGEIFKVVNVSNSNYSAHDIQVGVFLRFTNSIREAGGLRVYWNSQTTNTYLIQSYPALGGPTNILGSNLIGPSFLDTGALTNSMRFYRLRSQ